MARTPLRFDADHHPVFPANTIREFPDSLLERIDQAALFAKDDELVRQFATAGNGQADSKAAGDNFLRMAQEFLRKPRAGSKRGTKAKPADDAQYTAIAKQIEAYLKAPNEAATGAETPLGDSYRKVFNGFSSAAFQEMFLRDVNPWTTRRVFVPEFPADNGLPIQHETTSQVRWPSAPPRAGKTKQSKGRSRHIDVA